MMHLYQFIGTSKNSQLLFWKSIWFKAKVYENFEALNISLS